MAGWLTQKNKILCKWQMIIIFTCIFHGFLNKINIKTKFAVKVIHIQLLVAMSICASSISLMKEILYSFDTYWKYSRIVPNNECSFKESLSDANTDTEADNDLKTYRNNQLDPEAQSDCDQYQH